VLVLSANTSFVGFPRLCRSIAADGFLPRPFAIAGHRLVFSIGILYLTIAAAILLIVFGGITDHLIPLFAIGAFLTFTLSQTAMVIHWVRQLQQPGGERRSLRMHLVINAVGAATTAAALVIIILAKFGQGAWITLVVAPAAIVLLKAIRHYYDRLAARVRKASPLEITSTAPPVSFASAGVWKLPSRRDRPATRRRNW
jgi:amino acid transporter